MGGEEKRRRRPRGGPREPSALERLKPEEAVEVLDGLLERHPGLRKEAEALARNLLEAAPAEGTAEALAEDLRALDIDDLNSRAGSQRWGYVDPTDAAHELCEEALQPYLEELLRHLELGLEADALETLEGIILGLYEARKDEGDGCLAWAGDFPLDAAQEALGRWLGEEKRGARAVKVKRPRPAAQVSRLRSFLSRRTPEWAPELGRVVEKSEGPRTN
ncbi:MAG: hypothetical protein HY721_21115 [Planctomycetes bacterium]|nr:hypothetical protein [Planctomycetota bacterium]